VRWFGAGSVVGAADAKQGVGYGYCGIKGLNALIATLSTGMIT